MNTKYEDSLFYQINSSAKYFDMLFTQFFKELDCGITGIEHLALCIINQTDNCCQRDLARILLKDRANTGKLVIKLEKMGLIKVTPKTKNNKLVKILSLTDEGSKLRINVAKKFEPLKNKIIEEVTEQQLTTMTESLKNFKEIVKKAVKTNI